MSQLSILQCTPYNLYMHKNDVMLPLPRTNIPIDIDDARLGKVIIPLAQDEIDERASGVLGIPGAQLLAHVAAPPAREVGKAEVRVEGQDLAPPLGIVDAVAGREHVDGSLAHAVVVAAQLVPPVLRVEPIRDGALVGRDVDEARAGRRFLQQRLEGLGHNGRAEHVCLECLAQVCERVARLRDDDACVVDEHVELAVRRLYVLLGGCDDLDVCHIYLEQ